MSETRRDRALFAARLRALPGKDRTILTTEAIDDICAELLVLHGEATRPQCPKFSRAWGCRCELDKGHEGICVSKGDAFWGAEP